MRRNALILLIIVAVVLAAVVGRFALGKGEKAESIDEIQKRDGVPVNAVAVEPASFERWRTFSGSVEGKEQAILYANIPARVRKVHFKQGDPIRKGRTIISLDPLSSAQAHSALNMARIQTQDAKRMYNRMLPLYQAGAISKEEFDQVKSAVEMASAGYTDATYTTSLKSPLRGVLTDLRVNPGDKIDPGQTLGMVADLSGAKMILDISQDDAKEIAMDQPVVIGKAKQDRHNGATKGRIAKISLSADMETRLFRVEVELESSDRLRPGTLQYAQVQTYRAESVISIPINAVLLDGDSRYVFVVNEQGKSEKRVVKTGHTNEQDVEITEGLALGDTVVIWGQNRLSGGEKVKRVEPGGSDESNNNDDAPGA